MPHFWDFGRSHKPPRNLQDGLFQIASQTCSLLVQVNNTNNISYGNNSRTMHFNSMSTSGMGGPSGDMGSSTSMGTGARSRTPGPSARDGDREQLLVLIPPTTSTGGIGERNCKYKPGVLGKPRLSTVLETPPSVQPEDETDVWSHGYLSPPDLDGTPTRWSNKNKWCRPSCIPISIICILIFLVVLLPLLDHAAEKALLELNAPSDVCQANCKLSLIESIPEGLVYPNDTVIHPSTFDTWLDLINSAHESIDIASLYWTLRQSEVYPDPSSNKGEQIFQSLMRAGIERGIKIRVAQNMPSQNFPNVDTELLMKRKAAKVRSVNFNKLLGGGVLHTKLWIIDRTHVYLGSANMDWRSLTQVKEMGIAIRNCSCLAEDVRKIFEVYWTLGEDGAKIPSNWPASLYTIYNLDTPMDLIYNNETFHAFFSSSPPPLNPHGRTNDVEALKHVILHAEKFVYISVMDYIPLTIYSPKISRFWPDIDDAIKTAAIEHKVKVKMLISWWNHSRPAEDNFLRSLASVNNAYPRVSIEVLLFFQRRFIVPATKDQQKIPFARVNHNKYMVSDTTAFIGTSNWSGDYFTDTAGISFVLHDPVFESQLEEVFERDWNSPYAHPMNFSEETLEH
nr:unnamed protein product [Callosobruchus chinensis]